MPQAVAGRGTDAPEIVALISLDTLRADAMLAAPAGAREPMAGLERSLLDDLAADGTFFSLCRSSAPYTSTSHATIFSGLWPARHGVSGFFEAPLQADTLFTRFRAAGYRTVFKTDFPIILGAHLGFDRDVDEYIVEDDDTALAALEPRRPTLAFLHFGGLHIPYGFHSLRIGGRDYAARVAELEREIGRRPNRAIDRLVETYRDEDDLALLLRYKRIVESLYEDGAFDRLMELYVEGRNYFFATRLRRFLNRLLDLLASRRSLVVIFGDHGETYDEDSYGHYNTLAEAVVQVPVLFWGETAGAVVDEPVRTVDIAPTVLELAGVATGGLPLDGLSLADTVRSAAAPAPRPLAYAQCRIPETPVLVESQRQLLSTGAHDPALSPHFLYKECGYDGPLKLTRQYYECARVTGRLTPIADRELIEHADARGARPRPGGAAQRVRSFMATVRGEEAPKVPPPTREHVAQLRAMGYRV